MPTDPTALVEARRGHLEYLTDRIVVDDDTIVTEGFINAYQPGRAAQQFGFHVDRLDATYLVAYRALVLWPFDADARLLGEDGYASFDRSPPSPSNRASYPTVTSVCSTPPSTPAPGSVRARLPSGGGGRPAPGRGAAGGGA